MITRVTPRRGSQARSLRLHLSRRLWILRLFQHRANHVSRTLADLLIDAAYIFANQSETEEQHADQEEREDVAVPQRGEALAPASQDETLHDDDQVREQCSHRYQHAEHRE